MLVDEFDEEVRIGGLALEAISSEDIVMLEGAFECAEKIDRVVRFFPAVLAMPAAQTLNVRTRCV